MEWLWRLWHNIVGDCSGFYDLGECIEIQNSPYMGQRAHKSIWPCRRCHVQTYGPSHEPLSACNITREILLTSGHPPREFRLRG